ncbi:MAG: response regulator [Deltaproteobacteria bacterium]|nr:response regulator [Deltaproteobacteria bacterium]
MHDPSRFRILVVDDDVDNQTYLRRLLNRHGYTDVATASGGGEVLDDIGRLDADLVLLDLHMPGRDGFDVLAELGQRLADNCFIPIVVLTSDPRPESRQRALQLGATDFLTRPFDHHELMARLRNLLDRRDVHRVLAEQVQLSESELRHAHAEMLVRLARAAEYRDDQTGRHTWRVGYLARLIAIEMSAERRFVDLLGLAARLHDVGKIGVPDRVLLKPGPLDPDEFAVMKQHTTIGARLLSGGHSPLTKLAETIALHHHEAWDGGGYPAGKSRDAIPLAGRIVAVADVFDALTHTRHYKDAWSIEDAIAEIRRQRGVKFDPDAVDAFDRVHANGGTTETAAPSDDQDEIARMAITASQPEPAKP